MNSRTLLLAGFLLCAFMLAWVAFSEGSAKPTTTLRVQDSAEFMGRRVIMMRPVVAYDIFGTPEENSAVPAKGDVLKCTPTVRDVGVVPNPGIAPALTADEFHSTVMVLECGQVRIAINGIAFDVKNQ